MYNLQRVFPGTKVGHAEESVEIPISLAFVLKNQVAHISLKSELMKLCFFGSHDVRVGKVEEME